MAGRITRIVDMEIDEISLVDVPAAPGAQVLIAKRATEEDYMPEIFDEQGNPVDPETLQLGDQVYDANGQLLEVVPDDAADELDDELEALVEEELEPVGKGFDVDELRESLSKALTDVERDEVVAKAFGQVNDLQRQLAEATAIAKSERAIRLEGEYVKVAKSYNIPADPETLGPVLMRMAETMSDADCAVIHKALSAAGKSIFDEIGLIGGGDNIDPMAAVDAVIEASIAKSGTPISKAEATAEYFAAHPEAYDDYLREQKV